MENKNTRGAEWNIWDLHIHTPNTGKNDQFKNSPNEDRWDKYLSKIEGNTDVKVLGITDYFSIDNYQYMVQQQKCGRIPNVYLIPNVELRILPVTAANKAINIHVLFDPELDQSTINRDFFSQLSFSYYGSKYSCTRENIIQLGKAFCKSVSDENAYTEGINQFNVDLPTLKKALNAKSLKGHYIVGVSNSNKDGNSGIQDDALAAIREEIYRLSDFIFSSNQRDIDFFLGKGKLDANAIIEKYGSIKPCLRGCDAHSFEVMFQYSDNRRTWIKALPTFKGLKQVLFEPEDRVRISEEKPEEKSDYQIIDSIQFNNDEMGPAEIKLNPGLNTIIGGRSSGKSMLLGCLATTIDHSIDPKESIAKSSFNEYVKRLSYESKIKWRDNTDSQRKIIYYSQSEISRKVREDENGVSGISGLLEKIVKENKEKNELINKYQSFLATNKNEINIKINQFVLLSAQITEKDQQLSDIGNKAGIDYEIIKLEKEIDVIKKGLVNYLSEEEDKQYQEYKNQIENYTNEMELLKSDITQFELLKTASIFSSNSALFSKLSDKSHKKFNDYYNSLIEEARKRWIEFVDKEIEEANNTIKTISNKIAEIKNSKTYISGEKFKEDNTVIRSKSLKLQEEKSKQNSIIKLEEEKNKLITERDKYKNEIWDSFCKYRAEANELVKQLDTQKDEVKIHADSIFIYKDFYEKAKKVLNKRNTEVKKFENYEELDQPTLDINIKKIYDGILSNNYSLVVKTSLQQTLIDLFSTNYCRISYDVNYDGDEFSKMSEGKKAFIVLRLLLDFDDALCPIIIDQPEDDLDNRAIYDQLVSYLRKQKKVRQIILATHNPNVVVGADAELVIVANQHGDNSPNQDNIKFEYYANAIEDSFTDDTCKTTLLSKGIREHICEILEGGDKAFEIRERKYGYKD